MNKKQKKAKLTLDIIACALSADARRIAGFSDIAVSAWSYFLTWGGRNDYHPPHDLHRG